jgi:hypothetical protein
MNNLALDDIVSDRKQGADENAVAFGALGEPCLTVGGAWQRLRIETTLCAGRHDYSIFNALRLHQAEDFGAEIIAPIRPAQAATRNWPSAQVNALNAGGVDENFAPRLWRGKPRNERTINLERQRLARGGRERIGAQRRLYDRTVETKDTVFIKAFDAC